MNEMKHILFTMKGCPYHLLDDEAHITQIYTIWCNCGGTFG